MNKGLVIIIALAALLGVLYFGGKAVKHSMVTQNMMNVTPTQSAMSPDEQSDATMDSQDDQSLSQVSQDDNVDLSSNGL